MTLPEYYAYQEKRSEAHFAKGREERDRRFAIALKKMKDSA
jgi:fumarate hydratase class II